MEPREPAQKFYLYFPERTQEQTRLPSKRPGLQIWIFPDLQSDRRPSSGKVHNQKNSPSKTYPISWLFPSVDRLRDTEIHDQREPDQFGSASTRPEKTKIR